MKKYTFCSLHDRKTKTELKMGDANFERPLQALHRGNMKSLQTFNPI